MCQNIYDVTVIGGGPAGLFSAFYAGLREMKTKIIDGQEKLGGKVHLYPQKMIWDIGGTEPIAAGQLIEKSIAQGLTFEPDVVLNTIVTNIQKDNDDYFRLQSQQEKKNNQKMWLLRMAGGGLFKPLN